jgi:hypothetical protein
MLYTVQWGIKIKDAYPNLFYIIIVLDMYENNILQYDFQMKNGYILVYWDIKPSIALKLFHSSPIINILHVYKETPIRLIFVNILFKKDQITSWQLCDHLQW